MKSEVRGVGGNSFSVMAHDLKEPLSLIRQLALAQDFENYETWELMDLRDKVVKVSEAALRQVNDLLKIARFSDSLFPMEPVSPRAVCEEVVAEVAEMFRFNRRELDVTYRNQSRLVVANSELLSSVVYNFLTNALHYAGEESVSTLSVRDYRGRVRIDVRDYGPALPIKIWREMQKGFIEQPLSIAMRPGSSGLGLYIASTFSKYMNAKVGAVRHRDGTSFYVELPVSRQMELFPETSSK